MTIPPDCSAVHMLMMGAMPIVVPWKYTPLKQIEKVFFKCLKWQIKAFQNRVISTNAIINWPFTFILHFKLPKVYMRNDGNILVYSYTHYLISWALSWGFWGSNLTFLQSRNSCRVVKGSCVMGHLSTSLHTSSPTSATRIFKAL